MKQTKTTIYIIGLLVLCGCENKSSSETNTYPKNTTNRNNTFGTTYYKINNSTFNNPTYGNSRTQFEQSGSYTLQ